MRALLRDRGGESHLGLVHRRVKVLIQRSTRRKVQIVPLMDFVSRRIRRNKQAQRAGIRILIKEWSNT